MTLLPSAPSLDGMGFDRTRLRLLIAAAGISSVLSAGSVRAQSMDDDDEDAEEARKQREARHYGGQAVAEARKTKRRIDEVSDCYADIGDGTTAEQCNALRDQAREENLASGAELIDSGHVAKTKRNAPRIEFFATAGGLLYKWDAARKMGGPGLGFVLGFSPLNRAELRLGVVGSLDAGFSSQSAPEGRGGNESSSAIYSELRVELVPGIDYFQLDAGVYRLAGKLTQDTGPGFDLETTGLVVSPHLQVCFRHNSGGRCSVGFFGVQTRLYFPRNELESPYYGLAMQLRASFALMDLEYLPSPTLSDGSEGFALVGRVGLGMGHDVE